MAADSQIRFYLGANSPAGFYSLYDQMLDPAEAEDIMILKGGPGCGKSSFMRRVAAAAEAKGVAVEYIQCSGDPESLDAVVFPALKTAIVDGTAPHVWVTQTHKTLNQPVDFDGLHARFGVALAYLDRVDEIVRQLP